MAHESELINQHFFMFVLLSPAGVCLRMHWAYRTSLSQWLSSVRWTLTSV